MNPAIFLITNRYFHWEYTHDQYDHLPMVNFIMARARWTTYTESLVQWLS